VYVQIKEAGVFKETQQNKFIYVILTLVEFITGSLAQNLTLTRGILP